MRFNQTPEDWFDVLHRMIAILEGHEAGVASLSLA